MGDVPPRGGAFRLLVRPLHQSLGEGGPRLSEAQPLLDLLEQHNGLIILGDPGAGKSTFLRYLLLVTALQRATAPALQGRIPFLLPLSAYANRLAESDLSLRQCLVDYYQDSGFDQEALALGPLLDEALRTGKALLLLDGLDEVRQAQQRMNVVDHVTNFFLAHSAQGNKFVLTSRLVGYDEVRRSVTGLVECRLTDFTDEEIERFVEQWTRAIETMSQGATRTAAYNAERERSQLLAEIRRNPGVCKLAANPLLLTILALMKRSNITLPEQRAELYETYVKTLLETWERARSLDHAPARDLNARETRKLLAPLALWMHEVNPGVGLVKKSALDAYLVGLCPVQKLADPEAAAEQFMGDVHRERSLLVERGGEQYGFLHTTLQEYLAAVGVVLREGKRDLPAVIDALAVHIDDPNWHEVSLLAVGYQMLFVFLKVLFLPLLAS